MIFKQNLPLKLVTHRTVADPGFTRGGGANSKGASCKAIIWPISPPKLHEIERIWTWGGGGEVSGAPLDPPM